MKNILNVIRHDARKLTSSVVAIITIMGLCIVPCLYAWFNIFSNWAPYDADATSRILVAVANEDSGADLLGLDVNVGDKISEALKANDAIGWRFVDSKEDAVEGVRAGDYYAALIVPEDFSMDVMSFVTGSFRNPQLIYYENEKKNAIAPKITGKAKTAVQEEVNATFIETLAKYVSDAASVMEASGYDPQRIFSDLGTKMDDLSLKIEDCEVMLNAASGLADSAGSLMVMSDQLLDSAEQTAEGSEELLQAATSNRPDSTKTKDSVSKAVKDGKKKLDDNLSEMNKDLTDAAKDIKSYNEFVEKKLDEHLTRVERMRQSAERIEKYLYDMGFTVLGDQFGDVAGKLSDIKAKMESLETAEESTWSEKKARIIDLTDDIATAKKTVKNIDEEKIASLDEDLQKAISDARASLKSVRKAISGIEGDLGNLGDVLDGYGSALNKLQGSLGSTETSLGYIRSGINTMAEIFNRIGSNGTIGEVQDLLADDRVSVAEYLASPVRMKTEVLYPIETYGSAMAPFYTVLAQWVGSLLTAVLIKTRIKKREDLPDLRLHESFFGRYGLYLFIGLAQALIVSLGDLLYVGIQCEHPLLFILQACMNGITFMMINYALVFALENIGLAAGVIILVIQVAGSGGTYPVEVLPKVFRVLFPFMPFRYSMDAMRECIAGTYDHTYAKCMGILCIFLVSAVLFGLIMYKPSQWINRLIAEGKEKSEIML